MKKMKFMAAIAATTMSVTAVSTSFPILQASANDSDIKISTEDLKSMIKSYEGE